MWTAKITNVSNPDSSGFIEVTFDVFNKQKTKYQVQTIRAFSREDAESQIKYKLSLYQNAETEAASLQVGEIINL